MYKQAILKREKNNYGVAILREGAHEMFIKVQKSLKSSSKLALFDFGAVTFT